MNKLTIRLAILTSIFLLGILVGRVTKEPEYQTQIEFVNCTKDTVDEIMEIMKWNVPIVIKTELIQRQEKS